MKLLLRVSLTMLWIVAWMVVGVTLEKHNINHNWTMVAGAFMAMLLDIINAFVKTFNK